MLLMEFFDALIFEIGYCGIGFLSFFGYWWLEEGVMGLSVD